MKTYRKELWFNIPGRRGFINITSQVEACLRQSGIREGLALVNTNHLQYPLSHGAGLPHSRLAFTMVTRVQFSGGRNTHL